jgi:molecular chaperone GrpE
MKKKTESGKKDPAKNIEIRDLGEIPCEAGTPDQQKVDQDLPAKLLEKEKEAKENYEKYLRAVAELENYKKFAAKERADLIRYNSENIIRDILPILDSLDRALDLAGTSKDVNAFMDGVRMIQEQLFNRLEKHGVRKIEAAGREFDPNIHEALLQVESDEHENNHVVTEFEKGYLLNDRLLKPAKVSVAKHPSGEKDNDKGNDQK